MRNIANNMKNICHMTPFHMNWRMLYEFYEYNTVGNDYEAVIRQYIIYGAPFLLHLVLPHTWDKL